MTEDMKRHKRVSFINREIYTVPLIIYKILKKLKNTETSINISSGVVNNKDYFCGRGYALTF